MLKLNSEFQKYNPFRLPAWRWERVLDLCDRWPTPGRCSRRDDEYVRKAHYFVRAYRHATTPEAREPLLWRDPALWVAHSIYENKQRSPNKPLLLEARILAMQTREEIAEVMSLLPETVDWYEALFFDVRRFHHQRDWVTDQILLPALTQHGRIGEEDWPSSLRSGTEVALPYLDGTLKLFAYFGGKYLVDTMITGFQAGKPVPSPEDQNNWLTQHLSTTIKRRSAQALQMCPIDKYNVMELLTVNAGILALEQSDAAQDQQRTSHERNVKTMLDGIPWQIGNLADVKGRKPKPLDQLDTAAAELRDDEILRIKGGDGEPEIIIDWPDKLPPPRKKDETIFTGKDVEL